MASGDACKKLFQNLPQCLPNCVCNMSVISNCFKMQRVLVGKVTIMNLETRMFSSKSNTSYQLSCCPETICSNTVVHVPC